MTHIYINLIAYSIWIAIAALFGLRRYTNIDCEVIERYFYERSHNWSRIVAVVMMAVVEIMHWHQLNYLWTLWKMEELASFFTFVFLAFFAYGLHRAFCWMVEFFEEISYDRAKDDARAHCKGCNRICSRADTGVKELKCSVMSKTCPCLEDGYDIRDVNYTAEVAEAIRKVRDNYSRHGLKAPSALSIRVPTHRVVVKENPYAALFDDRWEFDIDLGGINLIINEEKPKSAKIINFPASAVAYAPEPEEVAAVEESVVQRDRLQVRLIRGSHGSFRLRMTNEGITCHLRRDLPNGRVFDQEVTFPSTDNYNILDEFLLSEQGKLLHRFINTPSLSEKQLARLG